MKDFIEYWDEVINLWSQGQGDIRSVPDSEKCWFVEGTNLHSNLMPEPYWGDPGKCSAVLLNYNPGGPKGVPPIEDNCHINHVKDPVDVSKMSGAMFKKYSDVAKGFPWKDKDSEYAFVTSEKQKASKNWMLRRNKWICRLVGESDLPPFFMEICGWHSYSWKYGEFTPAQYEYLKEKVIPVLNESINNSKLGIGLSIGKIIGEKLLGQLGYTDITGRLNLKGEVTQNGWKPIPANNRWYRVYQNNDKLSIINTWSEGFNIQPGKIFHPYEMELIKQIKSLK